VNSLLKITHVTRRLSFNQLLLSNFVFIIKNFNQFTAIENKKQIFFSSGDLGLKGISLNTIFYLSTISPQSTY